MSEKLTNEIIDQRLEDRNIKRLGDYINRKTKIQWKCLKNNCVWEASIGSVLYNKSDCPKCAGNFKLSNEDIDYKLINRDIKRLGDYINCMTKIQWQCLKGNCNYIWQAIPDNVVRAGNGCPKCANKIPLTNEEIDQKLIGRNIKRLDNFIGSKNKITWQCLKSECNFIWKATCTSIIISRTGCPKCGGSSPLNNEIIDQRLERKEIKRLGNYINANTKIKWQCLKSNCNFIWEAIPASIVIAKNPSGCPSCNLPGQNEKKLCKILQKYNLNINMQYPLKKIEQDARRYRFDIYFPDLKFAIEYHGEQHYTSTRFFGSKTPDKDFEKQQKRDQYVRNFCKKHDIELLEIDYRFFNNNKLEKAIIEVLIPYINDKYNKKDNI